MPGITGGVDTHLDVHVAAALNEIGGLLGTRSFPTTPAGYRALLRWLAGFGPIERVGVEGTGSYGAGLTRFLLEQGVAVVEVHRPDRRDRRMRGKSDVLDAVNAARAALSGQAAGRPKDRSGNVESIRVLRVIRTTAVKARTQALNQLRSLVATAPAELRQRLRGLSIYQLVTISSGLRPGAAGDTVAMTKYAMRSLARRVQQLDEEIDELDALIHPLVTATAPELVATFGAGPETASPLLMAAGDNPGRLRSEAAFARLCGSAPIPTGSGKTDGRHRLHRGGDRQANSALWRIVMTRMGHDLRTQAYVERRTKEGLTKKEIIRCLKRYVAREVYRKLPHEIGP